MVSGKDPGDGESGDNDMLLDWKKVAAATAVGLTIFGGGFLLSAPEEQARAAMAPSLMQDEKGYISIFEKVSTIFEERGVYAVATTV